MKTSMLKSLLACAMVVAGILSVRAQPTLFAVADYMFVGPEKSETDYLATEKLWQRLHQKAIDAGICRGWYLQRVEQGGRHSFVTVRVYNSLDKIANPWPSELSSELYNDEEQAKMQQTEKTRELVQSELWQLEAAAMKAGNTEQPGYIVVDYMKAKPGKLAAYYDLESKVFKKVQQARVDAGQLQAWFFVSRMFPSGTDAEFDFLTVNEYADQESSRKDYDMKTIQAALTEDEMNQAMTVQDSRSIVREEIWHPVMRALPAQ